MVSGHIGYPGGRLVAARAHLVEGDGRHGHVVAVEAHGRHVAFVGVDEVLVEPDVAPGCVGNVEFVVVHLGPAHPDQVAETTALHPRTPIAPASGQPPLPEVGRFHQVVVNADDRRDLSPSTGFSGLFSNRHVVPPCSQAVRIVSDEPSDSRHQFGWFASPRRRPAGWDRPDRGR